MSATETHLLDESAELAVLGACIVRNEALDELADVLEPTHFRRGHHAVTYAAMRRLHQAGQPVDLVTLRTALCAAYPDITPAWIASLTDGMPRSANVAHYARIVREQALRRELTAIARRLLADTESLEKASADLLEETEQAIYALTTRSMRAEWVSGAELAAEIYPVLESLHDPANRPRGIATGLRDLDRLTRGLQAGDLVLLGARPSVGKSSLAMQIAMRAAEAVPTAFFSLEMSRQQLGLRTVAAEGHVDNWRMLSGYLSEVELQRAGQGLTALANARVHILDAPNLSPVQARSKLRTLASRVGPIGLVVIDYLQLMAPLPEHRREPRHVQVAGISRALKILARELAAPFLVLSQLNRRAEMAQDKRPSMADLRESGALEQDADLVLLLHRPELTEPDKPELKGKAELILAKQRSGPVGLVDLHWRGPEMTFHDTERRP